MSPPWVLGSRENRRQNEGAGSGVAQGCQKEPEAAALRWLLGVSTAGYLYKKIEEIKSCQPEVKASKLDEQLRSYGNLKSCMGSDHFGVYMNVCMQAPTCRRADAYSK